MDNNEKSTQSRLYDCLKELYGMIERNDLVRNTLADSQPDWMPRMIKLAKVLKEAQELVGE